MDTNTLWSFLSLHLFVLALSCATALLEIQIEGANGWAAKLPTWRYRSPLLQALTNRPELTGYHFYLNIHLLLLFHFPLVFSGFSWFTECTIISAYLTYNILWDFLWFVLNPVYGWCGYRYAHEKIWWFKKWTGVFPTDYYLAIALSGVFALARGVMPGARSDATFGSMPVPLQHLLGWAMGLAVSVIVVWILIRAMGQKCEMPRQKMSQRMAQTA